MSARPPYDPSSSNTQSHQDAMTILPPFREAFPDDLLRQPAMQQSRVQAQGQYAPAASFRQSDMFVPRTATTLPAQTHTQRTYTAPAPAQPPPYAYPGYASSAPPRIGHPHSSSRSSASSPDSPRDGPSRFIILRPADGVGELDVAAYSRVSLPQAEWALSAGRLTTDPRTSQRDTPESEPELSEGSGAGPPRARGRRVRGSDAKVLPCPWPGCPKTYTSVGNINRHVRTVHGSHPPDR